jgi:hypothetical protein
MLEIGRDKLDNTLFLVKDGQNITNRIINAFDLEGINCLFITHSYKYGSLRPNCSTKYYNTYYEEIPELLAGNLFRVDVIIISVDKNYPIVLESVRTITDLPIIFIGNDLDDFSYTKRYINDFKYIYEMYKDNGGVYSNIMLQIEGNKWEENFLNSSYIKDIKNDWVTTLNDLQIEYYRDKKIELILKDVKK